ncbi:hypothetical protein PN480_09115 [Dolichospermum circinale CS-1225]|uniref:hypothetical protein n=1 Tax=Dolichospermum circinale TaxID=109265 RepID=UPI000401456F|nr:hypothetical protein [Dolichospermum circinale]MDB9522109.1 hypothetical protein [Dolichospermum circinale CS-1225]
MYKLEIKLDGKFINNFSTGSIYDLVFIDLEFWPDYVNGKATQRIYGYTLTRILKTSKQQYIKVNFLEFESEEDELIKEIIKDIDNLKDKIFIGFNIRGSDLIMLRRRLKALSIYIDSHNLNIFDFQKYSKIKGYKGLNGLFEYLEIKVNKKIDGSYFHKNVKKVFLRKNGWIDILLTMFEYCLEDAAGYFEIVLNWHKKNSRITKDMITNELLCYLPKGQKISLQSVKLEEEIKIELNKEILTVEDTQSAQTQLITTLTVADLENLIIKTVKKVLQQELQKLK